ncbi:MAG: hypothetical protein LBL58_17440 [Tannerellaceae bacterium]|jgi:hypothetical protein|nr:hypothetical protein [Tannerellaceae bacterium]
MKRLVYLLSLLTLSIVSFLSCSQDNDVSNNVEPKYTTRLDANLILVNYLELIEDKYVLNISLQEAKEIGISTEMYINTQNEIQETNEIIKRTKSANQEIQLTDPQEALKLLKSGDIVKKEYKSTFPPRGSLSSTDQMARFMPYIARKELFSIYNLRD